MSTRYYTIGKEQFPSVTTITGILDKPFLMYWYGKHGTQVCKKISKIARSIGKHIHEWVELDCLGKDKKLKVRKVRLYKKNKKRAMMVDKLYSQFYTLKSRFNLKTYKSELTVYSKKYKYAGTLDWVGLYGKTPGKRAVAMLDWKSSSGIYIDYQMQVAAYYYAYLEMYPHKKIKKVLIVRFKKEGKNGDMPEIREMSEEGLKAAFKAFLGLRRAYVWQASKP